MRSITPQELHARLAAGERIVLIDVREPQEHAIAKLPGSKLIPMSEIAGRIAELDADEETVVCCHHGIRSAHVIAYLEAGGFTRVSNLRGGIDAWAREVDPAMPRY